MVLSRTKFQWDKLFCVKCQWEIFLLVHEIIFYRVLNQVSEFNWLSEFVGSVIYSKIPNF